MDIKKLKKQLIKKYDMPDSFDIAFIMGSGLSAGVEIENKIVVPYEKVGMPKSKVQGFKGEFVFGTLHDKKVIKITRYHYYESGDMNLVKLPFQILKEFNVKLVIMATATGGVKQELDAGDLLVISDHINLAFNNPFIASEQIKFVDMNNAYDKDYCKQVLKIAKDNNINICEGVHAQLSGPNYETPAEVKFLEKIGVSTVSMSTAFDTLCARYYNIKVLAFASVSNKAGDIENEITHEEVLHVSQQNSQKLKVIISEFVKQL